MNESGQCGHDGGEVAYEVSDAELMAALGSLSANDFPELGDVLAKYVQPLQTAEAVSPRRRQAFMAQATSLGLIDAAEGLSLREYMAAPLLLPVYIEAAATSVCAALRQFATGARSTLDPVQALDRLTVYATLVQSPRVAMAGVGLRGRSVTPVQAYQAGSVSIFVGSMRGAEQSNASTSLDGLVALEGAEPVRLAGSRVRLIGLDGAPRKTQIDQLGTFRFDDMRAGPHRLEIELSEMRVVVENVEVTALDR